MNLIKVVESVYNSGQPGYIPPTDEDHSAVEARRAGQGDAASKVDRGMEPKGLRACSQGVQVFLTGGERSYGRGQWLRGVWSFNTITNRWKSIGEGTVERRRHHGSCVVRDKVSRINVSLSIKQHSQ